MSERDRPVQSDEIVVTQEMIDRAALEIQSLIPDEGLLTCELVVEQALKAVFQGGKFLLKLP